MTDREKAMLLESRKRELTLVYGFGFGQAIEAAITALNKQNRERWIPLTEGLPEDGERVLITYGKNVIRATWDQMRGDFYDTNAMSLDKDLVSAWCPLPEPYVEEGDNE